MRISVMINNHIDFDNPNVSRFLGFEDSALIKRTPEGLEFKTYIGYYYYLITGSVGHEFLKGTTKQDFAIKRLYNYKNLPDLNEKLGEVLEYNLRNSKEFMEGFAFQKDVPISWNTKGKLTAAQNRWLIVLQFVLAKLSREEQ